MNADRPISRRTLLGGLALAATATRAHAQGFAGLGSDAAGFAPVTPGRQLVFPADFGAHPEFRIEWWYLTANLRDAQGARYGVQWTLFRQALAPPPQRDGWASQQIWMGHAAVTGADDHRFAETFARGGIAQAGVTAMPFHAWIDRWEMKAYEPFDVSNLAPIEVTARGNDFAYTLRLDAAQALVPQGDRGYSRKSDRGQASYYYSQPCFTAAGDLTLAGRPVRVTGPAWMDREWSSQPLAADQTGWDWFSLHLDSGEKIMLFRLRQRDGADTFAGNWIARDGRSIQLAPSAIAMAPTGFTGIGPRKLPTRWRLDIAGHGLAIDCTPLNPHSWMATRFPYWEGPIACHGSHAGVGYLEMTGY